MQLAPLTFKSIRARAVVLKLKRPVVARIATITDWPLILIDLFTEEGIVGRSYLEPYTIKTMKYLVPALQDFGAMLKGRRVAPVELYDLARKSLHFVGYQGLSMIAVSGLDMAAWDALAKARDVPLCVLLGGSVGPVKAYNSNGLWLQAPEVVAKEAIALRDEGGFTALKLRLGRDRPSDDLAAIHAIRAAVGDDMELMADFNQGLHLGDALQRCHMIDDEGLAWIEEPIVYDNFDGYAQLTAELKTPIQIGENFYGPRDLYTAAVGDDMELMADFNQGLHLGDALQRCHMIDDEGLAWIEEPIVYDNFDGYAQLTAELKTPIQIGENFYGPRDLYTALQRKACDLVMPDFMRIGGVTGWLKASAIAGAAGIPMSTHLYPEVAAHVMRVTETAHWLEWQDWADPVLQKHYEMNDGSLHIPDVPGVGLDWNEEVVASMVKDGGGVEG
jgi:mandelate racemase